MPRDNALPLVEFDLMHLGRAVEIVPCDDKGYGAGVIVSRIDELLRLRELVDYAIESQQCAECTDKRRRHYEHASKWADIGILSHA